MQARRTIRADVAEVFSATELRAFRRGDGRIYTVVGHNPDHRLLTDIWLGGFGSLDNFRAVLDFVCERFECGGYSYWLADLRHLSESFFEAEEYLARTVVPRVMAAGMQREAVVAPALEPGVPQGYDVFGAADTALRRIADGRIRGFTDIAAARAWLLDGNLPGA
ncbi:hypothetical protein [Minwuia thermotolerans]|uniref:Uncharacterized protein n=1 Tax=Minwuia thermotolerans TaxID=2056226 RepID=A0A2M9FWT5_9PROT|nr:hypothetical protein [Minwuia thermotolerans]PJK27914.1 hypothetical protein CVT23_19435 [Minwuia thermotolerans]